MSYYVTNENSFLDIKNAHLRVTGNVHTDVLKVGSIGFQPTGSNIPGTVNFTNVTTGVTTSSNLDVGGTLNLGTVELSASTHTLDHVTARGNVTSTTVQFDNATTGLVTTANVEVGGELTVSGNVSDLNVVSNVNMLHTANTASIKLNSNVVTEFPRSKKLIKYPRVALTQNALNNGYTVTSSTQESSSRAAWKVFNNAYAEGNGWRGTGTYSTSDGSFTGTWVDFSSGSQTISTPDRGDWLQIILPEKIRLEAVRLQPRYSTTTGGNPASYGRSEFIRNGAIWGSNDGSSWDKVYTINSGLPGSDTSIMTFDGINSTTAYNYFVLVITDTSGTSAGTLASFSEWELFGVPEYDPEAHGTDVVVKSYPNVPNTDWLEVYYDGQDYPNMPATIDNKTGVSTYDATPNGGVGFDSTYKAFTFNKTDNQYLSASTPMSGNYVHSFSVWFKPDTFTSNSGEALFFVGVNGTNTKIELFMESDRINYLFGNNSYQAYPTIENGKWYHIVVTYNGTGGQNGREIYLNNVKLKGTHSSSSDVLALPNGNLVIGRYPPNSTYDFGGSIANFRLFNRALSSDEIYQLYAYQKEYFGHSTNNMTLKAGRLGIGTSEPLAALDVRGAVNITPYGYLQLNQGNRPTASSATHGMRWTNTDNVNHWHLFNSDNDHFRFVYNGSAKGYVDPNDSNAQMNFTGQHRTFIKDVPFSQVGELEGLIVSSDQNKYIKMSGGIEVGSNAITTNESLPVVSLSNVVTDKKCFGVISASEDPENRTEHYGVFGTIFEKEKGDTRVYINSVGEGAIWVSNIGGSLEAGDYITTSNVAGYGQKQESEFLANYTVAKITMDCDFEPMTQPIQIIKTHETGENVLDEHDQIQWEDHPTETEKAYKLRYLTIDGTQTDEANAVHTAAFVGCTYHCG